MEKQTILVYLETAEDQVIKVSLEALNAARQLAAKTGKNVTAVLIGSAAAAGAAAAYGADEVVHVAADSYQADRYTEILTTLYQRAEASALLLGSGRDGKELAARVAARVGAGCVTDAMALAEDGSWVRSVYGRAPCRRTWMPVPVQWLRSAPEPSASPRRLPAVRCR